MEKNHKGHMAGFVAVSHRSRLTSLRYSSELEDDLDELQDLLAKMTAHGSAPSTAVDSCRILLEMPQFRLAPVGQRSPPVLGKPSPHIP